MHNLKPYFKIPSLKLWSYDYLNKPVHTTTANTLALP